jgi:hypothetical protein
MKTGKLYRQVFIEGKEDLPKEGKTWYFTMTKGGILQGAYCPQTKELKNYWIEVIDWYLEPLLESQGMPSDEDVIETIGDALYATEKFPPEQCDELASGILLYMKESEWFKSRLAPQQEPVTDEEIEKLLGRLLYGQYSEDQTEDYLMRKLILDEWMRGKLPDRGLREELIKFLNKREHDINLCTKNDIDSVDEYLKTHQ